jgi:hypothetical protein
VVTGSLAPGNLVLVDAQWTTVIRARANGGAWASVAHEAIHAFDRLAIGHDHVPANHLGDTAWGFRDNAQTLLPAPFGWNHKVIECFEEGPSFVTADGTRIYVYEPTEDVYRAAAGDLSIAGPWVILTEGDGILTAYEPLETTYRGEAP